MSFNITTNSSTFTDLTFSTPTTWTLIILNLLIIVFGFTGNSLVLYGSVKHNALQMDWISSFFVEIIALSDVCVCVFFYIPCLITLIMRRWVFGEALCYISGYFLRNVPTVNEIWVFVAMSSFRLWMLKKTKAARERISRTSVRIMFISLLIFSTLMSVVMMKENHAVFTQWFFNCVPSSFVLEHPSQLSNMIAIVWIGLPLIVVIITNLIILYIVIQQSRKVGRNALENKKTVMTILMVTGVFILSYFPILFKIVAAKAGWSAPDWWYIFTIEVAGLNVIANPIIYTVKSRRFRKFLKKFVHIKESNKICSSMGESSLAQASLANVNLAQPVNVSINSAMVTQTRVEVLANGTVISDISDAEKRASFEYSKASI